MWGELHTEWTAAFPQGRAVLTDKSYHYPQHDEPKMVVDEIVKLIGRTHKE